MAVDTFINIDGIKGESIDDKHKGEIEVLSWSWGATQSGTTHSASGGGAAKVSVQDLTITKYVDKSTPFLFGACCTGKHIIKADLVIRKAGGAPLEYLKIHCEELIVAGYTTGGSGGQERITENITLNFARVKLEYTPQKADGTGDASIIAGFDIAKNCKIG